MYKHVGGILILAAALSAAGCAEPGAGAVLSLDVEGRVGILAYVDRDGDGAIDMTIDRPAEGVRLSVVRAQRDTVASVITGSSGTAALADLPIGEHRIVVDPASLGDSLEASNVPLRIVANDSVEVFVTLLPRLSDVAAASGRLVGSTVAVEGVALNGWTTFGDSTLYLADATGTIRTVAAPPADPVAAGDSVRVIGRIGLRDGEPAIVEGSLYRLGAGALPEPIAVSTATAASAAIDGVEGALVRISNATIVDASATAGGDVLLRVDDGSGMLEVLLDRNAAITSPSPFIAQVIVDATGLLVPTGSGSWRLMPRASLDLEARIPTATAAQARQLVPGRLVSIEGVALNDQAAFGDRTVHLVDSTSAIRLLQVVSASIFAGDSIRVVGLTENQQGQVVLRSAANIPAIFIARVAPREPLTLTTLRAATAEGGNADAMLVRIAGATVDSLVSETRIIVDDGSGPLTLLLDVATGVQGLVPGAVVDVTGLLIPATGGWLLRPRRAADLTIR